MPTEEKFGEEFELIPVSPLRKMEKRLEDLEHSKAYNTEDFYKEMVDIIRMNQQLVNEIAKANDALKLELARLPPKLEELISKLDEIVSFIKSSAIEETTSSALDLTPLTNKLDQLIETNKKIITGNETISFALDDIGKKMKRPLTPMMGKPFLYSPKPTV